MADTQYTQLLLDTYHAAIKVAMPDDCVAANLPDKPAGKTYVIGAGKAAARMAQVFEEHWPHEYEGIVITRYGYNLPTKKIKVIEAAHPVPDEAGQKGAMDMLDFLKDTKEEDLVICLLSGGGSSLLTCPVEGVDFASIQDLNKQLLKCGASIHEINTVRKHLNRLFGGKLALAAAPAKLITLSISDVAGDDPSTIASGPTVADPTTLEDAKNILQKYNISPAAKIQECLNDPQNETPKADHPVFQNCEYKIIAAPQKSMEAAAEHLNNNGFTPYILSSEIEGDTNEVAAMHVAMVKQIKNYGQPFKTPCAIISGGETTVKVTGNGQGGPNTQMMLASVMLLSGMKDVYALSCDTDGVDGNVDNAGAVISPDTLQKAKESGLSPKQYLENNDSYNFFKQLGTQVEIPPTHTNVNDIRVFLIK